MLCDYGCDQEALFQLKNGKWCCSRSQNSCSIIRKKNSEALKKVMKEVQNKSRGKLSKSGIEAWKDPVKRKHIIDGTKKAMNRPERRERQRQYMLNGGATIALKGMSNESKEELELRDIVLELYPDSKSHYKVLEDRNYEVDIALVEYRIAIEFDGYHHFKDQKHFEYHKKRQEEIETEDWSFLRYVKVPTKEQIVEDINHLYNKV